MPIGPIYGLHADNSISPTVSSTVHTKCPSGTQSRIDGGI